MAQHDYVIDNQGFPATRADLNAALDAIKTVNAGATAPAVTAAFMPWYDTTAGVLKIRNAANTAWLISAAQNVVTTSATDVTAGSLLTTGAGVTQAYRAGNILGTVSQSAGVPTGAVIEAGSNANGSYTRFADGTMICRSIGASVNTSTWSTPNKFNDYGTIDFASAFISTDISISLALETDAVGSSGRQYASQYSTPSVGGVANVSFEFLGTVSGYTLRVTVLAIGRWF